jgi:hypothetical protein
LKGILLASAFVLSLFIPRLSAQDTTIYASSYYSQDSIFAVRNAIKVDPVQIVFGDFRLYYERILTNHFSVELGAGITRRNYASNWFDDDLDNLGENVDIKTGYSFSLSIRRYFHETEELDGVYLALGINHREHVKDFNVIDTTGTLTGDSFRDQRRTTSVIFKLGYQALPLSSNVFADFFTGPAIRFKEYDIVQTLDINDPRAYSIQPLSEVTFGWEVGVRVGFGF